MLSHKRIHNKIHKKILVTGASGFVGRHALAPLLRLGFEVHAISTKPRLDFGPADVQWHQADLLEAGQSQNILALVRPTHLLHFAWYAEHGKFWNSSANLDWLAATLALLKAFVALGGKRFVGAGSCAEYDWAERDFYDEKDALGPSSLYGAVKASAFLSGAAFAQTAEVEFAWGRIFHLFGPNEAPDRIIPALIRAHLNGEKLNCSQGTQLRDFLPALAIGDAFAHLCDSKVHGAINIGSGVAMTLRGLSDTISNQVGQKAEIHFGAFHDAGPNKLLPSVNRLTQELRWKSPITLEAGLGDAIEWWKTKRVAENKE